MKCKIHTGNPWASVCLYRAGRGWLVGEGVNESCVETGVGLSMEGWFDSPGQGGNPCTDPGLWSLSPFPFHRCRTTRHPCHPSQGPWQLAAVGQPLCPQWHPPPCHRLWEQLDTEPILHLCSAQKEKQRGSLRSAARLLWRSLGPKSASWGASLKAWRSSRSECHGPFPAAPRWLSTG